MLSKVQRILVEKSAKEEPLTRNVLSKLKNLPVEYVDATQIKRAAFKPNELFVTRQKSNFVKKCPGTPKYRCCNYYVLNLGIGCAFNCTYCFLHHYMNMPFTVYANTGDLIDEVREFYDRNPNKTIRLGSGEFIDSVGFDEITGINETLIPALSKIKNILFEVKTKSNNIGHLLGLEHNKRVVISWSLNTSEVIKKDEEGASSLKERLEAARLCQEAGYKIGFHFDPLIYYKGWESGYRQVVDLIFESINPDNIAWISLGALRFNPSLKPIIKRKFPNSRLIYEELVPGLDGKLRYFIAIRRKLFRAMVNNIRTYSKEVPVYLCMESKALAEEVGALSKSNGLF